MKPSRMEALPLKENSTRDKLLLKTFAISVTTMALLTACELENNASSTIKAEPSVAQLDKEIKVLKEVRVNLQLLQQVTLDMEVQIKK